MTLKRTFHRLAIPGATVLALLAVIAVVSHLGLFPSHLGGGVVSAAPEAQLTPPEVSFSDSAVMTALESQTVAIQASMSPAATSALEVGYTISWPTGRSGDRAGYHPV